MADDNTIPYSFLPVIPASASTEKRDIERSIRGAIRAALQLPDARCAKAIAPFKCDGMKLGHKVLDNGAAWQALVEAAPEPFKSIMLMEHEDISYFRRTQLTDIELRRHFLLDKRGKITGPKPPKEEKPQEATSV